MMSRSISVLEIKSPEDPLYRDFWLPLYREAFPDSERLPESYHDASMEKDDRHVFVFLDEDGRPVGMARFDIYPHPILTRYAYLMYAAVAASERSKGYGSLILSAITRIASEETPVPPTLALEVENPDDIQSPEAKTYAERRVDFYRRNGFRTLTGVRYFMRVPDGEPVYMRVMVKPIGREVDAETAYLIALDLAEGDGGIELTGEIGLS